MSDISGNGEGNDYVSSPSIEIYIYGSIPEYASEHAAGSDLKAYITEDIIIHPHERVLIPTNIYMSIPIGYEGQVRPRSGLAIKHGISIINSPGTIDADYRGEIKVPLINLGGEDFVVSNGDRIAQIIISPCVRAVFIPVEKSLLSDTHRGEKGFGSTGMQ